MIGCASQLFSVLLGTNLGWEYLVIVGYGISDDQILCVHGLVTVSA